MAVSRINEAGLDVNQYGNRNLTINGAMQVSQRGTVTGITGTGYGGPDRCAIVCSNSGTYTLSQAADAPSGSGFDKSLDVACTSSDTYGTAADVTHLRLSSLESQDCMKFEHGTSSAKKLTVQFYVKCSYADTFGLAFVNHDSQKSNVQKFTINSADTWQLVTLTYNGDTAAGFNNDANLGLSLDLFLGGGSDYTGGSATLNNWDTRSNNQSTYVSSTSTKFGTATSHTFNVTGLQLEIGDTATDFEHRSFSDEVVKCQRYFNYVRHAGTASNAGLSNSYGNYYPQAPMRAVPTATAVGNDPLTAANFTAYPGGASVSVTINAIFETENGNITVRPYVAGNNTYTYMEGFISLDAEL